MSDKRLSNSEVASLAAQVADTLHPLSDSDKATVLRVASELLAVNMATPDKPPRRTVVGNPWPLGTAMK